MLLVRYLCPVQRSNFSCAEPNANQFRQRILLINITFGSWKVRRLNWALENTMYEDTRTKFGEDIGGWAKENWLRYLDDCYIKWIFGEEQFHVLLNNLNPNIKFTIEHDTKQLAFLDILVKNDDILTTDINYKAPDTRQYLDFTSNHPRHIKKNIPYNLTRRMCTIVDDEETTRKK